MGKFQDFFSNTTTKPEEKVLCQILLQLDLWQIFRIAEQKKQDTFLYFNRAFRVKTTKKSFFTTLVSVNNGMKVSYEVF